MQFFKQKLSEIDIELDKKSKMLKFLSNFQLRLINFGLKKLRKPLDDKTRPKECFSKKCRNYGQKCPQNDPNIGKTERFQVEKKFTPHFVHILSYFLALNGLKISTVTIMVISNRQF